MKKLFIPILTILFASIGAKSQTGIQYSGPENAINSKPKVLSKPKTYNSKKVMKNIEASEKSIKGDIIISRNDNMPCLLPKGNFNMPIMKVDTLTRYTMRIEKIK